MRRGLTSWLPVGVATAALAFAALGATPMAAKAATADPVAQIESTIASFFHARSVAATSTSVAPVTALLANAPSSAAAYEKARPAAFAKFDAVYGVDITSVNETPVSVTVALSGNIGTADVSTEMDMTWTVDGSSQVIHSAQDNSYAFQLAEVGSHWVITGETPNEFWVNVMDSSTGASAVPTSTASSNTLTAPTPSAKVSPDNVGSGSYNRSAAAAYANTYWSNYNTAYYNMSPNDCTNFVSQALLAGGMVYVGYGTQGDTNWWYIGAPPPDPNWSYSWAVAPDSFTYWVYDGGGGTPYPNNVYSPSTMQANTTVGDTWYYNTTYDGDSSCAAGAICHAEIEVLVQSNGVALCDAHTTNRYQVPCYWNDGHYQVAVHL